MNYERGEFETVRLSDRDPGFEEWISHIFYKQSKTLKIGVVRQSLPIIRTMCRTISREMGYPIQGKTFPRVVEDDLQGTFWYDLGRDDLLGVKTSMNGVTVEPLPEWYLRLPEAKKFLGEQLEPDLGAYPEDFLKLHNHTGIDGEQFRILTAVWLIYSLMPTWGGKRIPCPILYFTGPPGSHKSTSAEMLKRVVDPSSLSQVSEFGSKEDTALMTSVNRILILDNENFMTVKNHTEELCRMATGGSHGKRSLYTDRGITNLDYNSQIIITSIDEIPGQNRDLLDRTIQVSFSPGLNKPVSIIQDGFKRDLPGILGGMFCTFSEALQLFDEIRNQDDIWAYPVRMQDFLAFGEACCQVWGHEPEYFAKLYTGYLKDISEASYSQDKFGMLFEDWLKDMRDSGTGNTFERGVLFSGSTKELYRDVTNYMYRVINSQARTENVLPAYFPKLPNRMLNNVREIRNELAEAGYNVVIGKNNIRISVVR